VSVASSSVAATSPTESTFPAASKPVKSRSTTKKGKEENRPAAEETTRATRSRRAASKELPTSTQTSKVIEADLELQIDEAASQKRRTRRGSTAAASTAGRTAGPPLIHELRDGMRYVDEPEPEAVGKRVTRSQVHELRDGVRWVDEG
jgi:hypothetical protein